TRAEPVEVAGGKSATSAAVRARTESPESSCPAEGHRRVAIGIDLAAVETRPLVLVRQQVVGFGHFGEASRRLGVVLIAVGMQFLGESPIGGLDVLLARAALHA